MLKQILRSNSRPFRVFKEHFPPVRFDKHTDVDGGEFGSQVHQVFGSWSGRLVTDDGLALELHELQGFAEEARQRW